MPTSSSSPCPSGSQTGLSIALPATSSAATSTGALSTVAAVYNDRLPIEPSHVADRHLAGRVVGHARGEVERNRVGPGAGDRRPEHPGQVVERLVPTDLDPSHPRPVEAIGPMVPLGQASPLRARVPLRRGVVGVASHPHHLLAVDRHHDPARRGADPAVRQALLLHGAEPYGSWIGGAAQPISTVVATTSRCRYSLTPPSNTAVADASPDTKREVAGLDHEAHVGRRTRAGSGGR